jgi:hypothetical protein
MTKEELVIQCLTDNPVMIQTVNNVERELSEEERIEAANAWADMQQPRQKPRQQKKQPSNRHLMMP